MGNQQLKTRTPIGSAVDKELYDRLKALSKETGVPVSKLLDKAIKLLLNSSN